MPAWVVQPLDEQFVLDLSQFLLLSPLKARLLATRGIGTVEGAVRFLSASKAHLYDPYLFREMDVATELLHQAIVGGDRILVHGDYDADGICGTALLYEVLKKLGADVHFFVPDRTRDGYGLARRVMDRGIEVGLKLLISVDCGSSNAEVVSLLARHGVQVIITDHHETTERIPDAHAFLNPKLPDETYPFRELAGAGVAFKLLQGLEKKIGFQLSLENQLDLVALGTLGDYSTLRDENRILVSLGLEAMREWHRPGLQALRMESNLPAKRFTARQVCFTLVPRLNSPGRMGSARDVVRLLVTADTTEAPQIAREIEEKNWRRRMHDNRVTEEACYLADIVLKRVEPSALVFSSSSWHEGVVGIGAARLAEKYNMPSTLIAVNDGVGKGSARSAGMVNIKKVLEWCSEYLIEYGGHKEAGGFSILEENIPDFQRIFEEAVEELAEGGEGHSTLNADAETSLEECDIDLISFIERLGPFGPGNHEPVLLVRDLEVVPGSRIVGEWHLKMTARNAKGLSRDLIGFSMAKAWNPDVITGKILDVLIHLRRNRYMGREEPELQIIDLRFAGDTT